MMDFEKNFFEKLSNTQDTIKNDITDIKIIQGKQEENLKEHMRRTDILEKTSEQLYNELKPIKIHVNRIDGVLKFLGLLSLVVSLISGLLKIFQFI